MKFLIIQYLCVYLLVFPSYQCSPLDQVSAERSTQLSPSNISKVTLAPGNPQNPSSDTKAATFNNQNKSISVVQGRRLENSFQEQPVTATVSANKTSPRSAAKKVVRLVEPEKSLDLSMSRDRTKDIRDKVGREILMPLFSEHSENYPEDKIRTLLDKTSSILTELFNVRDSVLNQNVSLTERTAWSYAAQGPREESLCRSSVKYTYPREANKDGSLVYVANDHKFMQVIETEVCSTPDEECGVLRDSLPYHMVSFCHQKYAYKKLLYLDGERLASDLFRYQSCCSCRVRYVDTSNDLRSSPTSAPKSNSERNPPKQESPESNSTMHDINGASSGALETSRDLLSNQQTSAVSDHKSNVSGHRLAKVLSLDTDVQVEGKHRIPLTRERNQKDIISPVPKRSQVTNSAKFSSSIDTKTSSTTHTIILQDDVVYKSDSS